MGIQVPKALIEISSGCNSDCIFCLRNQIRTGDGSERAVDFTALACFLSISRKLGMKQVELAGDEPTVLAEPVLKELIAACRAARFKEVRIVTNGVKLGQEGFVARLIDWGINSVVLPLYGSNGAVHDRITQKKGSFRAVGDAIKYLAKYKGKVAVLLHTVVLRQNEDQVGQMAALAEGWGLPLRIDSLSPKAPHVDYRGLLPRKPIPLSVEFHYQPFQSYHLFGAQLRWPEESRDALFRLWSRSLEKMGVPKKMAARVLDRCQSKPMFRDPKSLSAFLEDVSGGHHRRLRCQWLQIAAPSEGLRFALRALEEGRDSDAAWCLRRISEFPTDSEKEREAKELARRCLERLVEKGYASSDKV